MFPERFSDLPAYAFPRLRALLDAHEPGGPVVHMTIGEPRHPFPDWVGDVLAAHVGEFARYPVNEGSDELRAAIAAWLGQRYGVDIDPARQVMALNGTREGLYNAAMALCPEAKGGQRPVILTPNPFYQVYAVAALSVGAEPIFVPATDATGHLPDYTCLPPEVLARVGLAYLCSPANPQGAVADRGYWERLIGLAEEYDFQILADECYSEIYRDMPPVGALQVARDVGADPERVLVFHSLSKRSNVPGLRSGFVAGGPESLARIKQLRTYAGAPLPMPLQRVAERLWSDETHVAESRALYVEKYAVADDVFRGIDGARAPDAGFFLWLPVADGEQAALRLWTETGVRVLPGAYLSRDTALPSGSAAPEGAQTGNPGAGYIRVAMVAPLDEMRDGLLRLRACLYD